MLDLKLTIALAGNPNCGKTTIFNNLTGSHQHVGNYPGVTVEKKEGFCHFKNREVVIIDLPGTYSLTAFSPEEVVTRNFIAQEKCDVIVSVVDAANLERNLYLTVQLLELQQPSILALNMIDVAEARDVQINDSVLRERLGVPVVRAVGSRNKGMSELLETAISTEFKTGSSFKIDYGTEIESGIAQLEPLLMLARQEIKFPQRWLALKLLENDKDIIEGIQKLANGDTVINLASKIRETLRQKLGDDPEIEIANKRYQLVGETYQQAVINNSEEMITSSDKIDKILTNRLFGLPIFLGMMWLVFNLVFTLGDYPKEWLAQGVDLFGEFISTHMATGELKSLVVEGIIGGVGSVVVFLPNILLMFLAIALLEDTGYMARAAFIMDRVMHSVGLHGKSFIPLLLGFGCNVPAVMGTRTLENPRDRLVTILVAPLMSCSAKLPIYTVLIAAFFSESNAGNVLFSIYLVGITLAVIMARIFRTVFFTGDTEPFVMELPPYRTPSVKGIIIHMWERSILYLQKAGTLILAVSVIVWFLTNYPTEFTASKDYAALASQANSSFTNEIAPGVTAERYAELQRELDTEMIRLKTDQARDKIVQSYAGRIGHFIEPMIQPLGFDWKLGIGLFAGFTAKEVLVSTLGTIYSVGDVGANSMSLKEALATDPVFNPLVAYGLMIFVLVYSPCLATIAVIKRETNSWRWPLFSMVYSTALAWVLAFLVHHGGLLLGFGR